MGIGFTFRTAPCERDKFFSLMEELSEQWGARFGSSEDAARVGFCRTGDLYVRCEGSVLVGDCQTNVAGAGFHAAAIRFVDALAQRSGVAFTVEDETDYYTHRDFARMREEHFYNWLRNIIRVVSEHVSDENNVYICWDTGQYTPESVPGSIVTGMGRFSAETLLPRVEREGIEPFAADFFLWNNEEKDAWYFRNTALAALWEDCHFMPSARSDRDRAVNEQIIRLVERAAELDRTVPLPVREYERLCELHGCDSADLSGAQEYVSEFPIGFRRGNIKDRLGNLTVTYPGRFLYSCEDNRDHVYCDRLLSGWHTVRISAFGTKEPVTDFSPDLFTDLAEEPETFEVGEGRCRAAYAGEIRDEEGSVYHQVIAEVISGSQITLFTLSFEYEEDRDWAHSFLRTLRAQLPKKQEE